MRRTPPNIAKKLLQWYGVEARDLPWRRTNDPYAIWVSEVMLQQTQVKTVIPYWERWIKRFPTVGKLAYASETTVLKHWEGLGYYRRARNLQKGAAYVVTELNGQFPKTHADVLKLPGVGPYTAGAICSIAYNQPTPIVDGNVIRVLTRLHGIADNPKETTTQATIWRIAEEFVTSAARLRSPNVPRCSHLNQALMELGALVCTPSKPSCEQCPLKRACIAHAENLTDRIPALPERRKTIQQRHAALIIRVNGSFILRQVDNERHNAGLWEFPSFDWPDEQAIEDAIRENIGIKPTRVVPQKVLRQTITHHRIELHVVEATFRNKQAFKTTPYLGVTPSDLKSHPMSSAHRRIANLLAE